MATRKSTVRNLTLLSEELYYRRRNYEPSTKSEPGDSRLKLISP